jgi:hypothetical protein
LTRQGDDGLLGRILWVWPEPVAFRLGASGPTSAIRALDRLRELDLQPGDPPMPIMVPLTEEGRSLIEPFARKMQDRQKGASGLLSAAFGKARGQALRLALVLEMLWWCGEDGASPPPIRLSPRALAAAVELISDYFMAMAEAVYGEYAVSMRHRNAASLAHWILRTCPQEITSGIFSERSGCPVCVRASKSVTRRIFSSPWAGCTRRRRIRDLGRERGFLTSSTPDFGWQLHE